MDIDDLRDLGGRFRRLCISTALGLVGSFAITMLLPTRDHFPLPPGSCGNGHWSQGWLVEGGDPVLMLAGAIAITIGVYGLWNLRVRAKAGSPRSSLPRAHVVNT